MDSLGDEEKREIGKLIDDDQNLRMSVIAKIRSDKEKHGKVWPEKLFVAVFGKIEKL